MNKKDSKRNKNGLSVLLQRSLTYCLTDWKDPANKHQDRDLALLLEQVAAGEIDEAQVLYEHLQKLMAPFADAANKIHWATYAFWPCADQLMKRSLDFVRGEAYVHDSKKILE